MKKYYQHIDPSDELFQNVTTLLYIDDDDPDVRFYVFDDGTKCSENFIGRVNDATAFDEGKCFAEISNPQNMWKFKKNEVVATKQYATGKNGEQYEIPDFYLYDHNTDKKVTFESYSPRPVNMNEIPEDGYLLSNIIMGNNVNNDVDVDKVKKVAGIVDKTVDMTYQSYKQDKNSQSAKSTIAQYQKPVNDPIEVVEEENDEASFVSDRNDIYFDNGQMVINVDNINTNDDIIINVIHNGRTIPMTLQDFTNSAMTPVQEKTVEKVVVKEVEKDKSELEIEGKNNPEYNLVNNMINMSKKEECTINMELDIPLPPTSVYDIIKNAYTEGMTETFLRIIANNMSVRDLRLAVETGLREYYNPIDDTENNDTQK